MICSEVACRGCDLRRRVRSASCRARRCAGAGTGGRRGPCVSVIGPEKRGAGRRIGRFPLSEEKVTEPIGRDDCAVRPRPASRNPRFVSASHIPASCELSAIPGINDEAEQCVEKNWTKRLLRSSLAGWRGTASSWMHSTSAERRRPVEADIALPRGVVVLAGMPSCIDHLNMGSLFSGIKYTADGVGKTSC